MTFVTGLYEDQRKLFWFLLFGIFAVLTFVFYHSSLGNFYVLDDFVRLRVVTEGNLHENFHFIPVPLFLYRLLYLLFGASPVPLRILHLLLNVVMCLSVFRFSILLLNMYSATLTMKRKLFVSLGASLLFCLHYIHVETIVYYSELHELLYSVFYLNGLICYFKFKQDNSARHYYLIFVYYLFCILSKETAVTMAVFIGVSELLFYRTGIMQVLKRYYPLAVITAAFAATRYFFFPSMDILNRPDSLFSVISETAKNFIFSFTGFLFSMDFVFLKDIYREHDMNIISSLYGIAEVYPLALIMILTAGAVYALILLRPDKLKLVLIVFVFISVLSYAWLAGYERYLYLPSAGLCLLLVYYLATSKALFAFHKIPLFIIFASILLYNIVSLEEKESNWIVASAISQKTVTRIVELTGSLPAGSKVFFKNLPDQYKGAWVLRYGVQEVPILFMDRSDVKFYYDYQKPETPLNGLNEYEYDYNTDKLYEI